MKFIKKIFIPFFVTSVLSLCAQGALLSLVKDNRSFRKQMYDNQQPAEEEEEKDEAEKRESNEFVSILCYSENFYIHTDFYYIDQYSELPFFDIIKPPPIV